MDSVGTQALFFALRTMLLLASLRGVVGEEHQQRSKMHSVDTETLFFAVRTMLLPVSLRGVVGEEHQQRRKNKSKRPEVQRRK